MKERYLYLLQSRKTDSVKVAEMVGSCNGCVDHLDFFIQYTSQNVSKHALDSTISTSLAEDTSVNNFT